MIMDNDLIIKVLELTNDVIINNNKLLEINKELIEMNIKKRKYACITIAITILIVAVFLLLLYRL